MDHESEFFGGSLVANVTADGYLLRTPGNLPGSARWHDLTPNAPRVIVLPFGNSVRNGESVTVHNASGTHGMFVLDQAAGLVTTLAPLTVTTFWKTEATLAGSWIWTTTTGAAGAFRPSGLVSLRLEHRVANQQYLNLRTYWDANGYDGVTPAALRLDVASGYVLGAASTGDVALDTGDWPAGSYLFLANAGIITGAGGDGGRGADVPPGIFALPGQAAGPGVRLRIDTAIVNYGAIQGGGGGGGGGIRDASTAGNGGGGGAGYRYGMGGGPGSGGGGASQGQDGGVEGGGLGGFTLTAITNGGRGGDPGQAGQSAGAVGGAGGVAILQKTGTTLTQIVAGTISGGVLLY